jgi:hypothetical protein
MFVVQLLPLEHVCDVAAICLFRGRCPATGLYATIRKVLERSLWRHVSVYRRGRSVKIFLSSLNAKCVRKFCGWASPSWGESWRWHPPPFLGKDRRSWYRAHTHSLLLVLELHATSLTMVIFTCLSRDIWASLPGLDSKLGVSLCLCIGVSRSNLQPTQTPV